ncbi:DUF4870 domain-containing protein [uncultured Dokdonia sp.]|uniref:DUF4870 domain-containing protein n=1 Tax=uncultured Dokdonia sp. TaxID=575653 RepID=UPI002618D819|nr:DUF4870 domain-containing protein [uncultured Dokdonia sp.]
MESTVTTHQKNLSTFIHLSTFSKWFVPFGNLIAPLILWSAQKNKSRFVDRHGRDAINFQLSILIYTIALVILSIPFFVWQIIKLEGTNTHFIFDDHFHTQGDFASASTLLIIAIIVGTLAIGLAILEIVSVISAAIKASNGENYKYPFTINFIKASVTEETLPPEENDTITTEDA